ncbi:energy transducer TonB [Simiduia aestuariiviva]|uniref:Protein TonB n=1 Tax=Simiduia aestuariiviva TaxID=1510459 RepID=A0A839UJK0_9GAMM|nr:energy transducer TonB [Simiduia aestuariiviva]MBB3166941.1 protein TonB [Simiduia aestuariiviva]
MNTTAFARPEFRIASALPTAALTTITLLYGMHVLIDRDYVEPDAEPELRVIDVVMKEPDPIVDQYEQPKKITEPEQMPEPLPVDPDWVKGDPTDINVAFTKPTPTKTLPNITVGDGNLVKQVMIAPIYPRRALERGIEGFVDVAYDVTAYGSTTNLQILHAEPAGVFDRAALAAVAKWKFRPQIIDDEPVATPNLRERVRFSIERN